MGSSGIKKVLLGNTGKYERILKTYSTMLSKRYPDRHLSELFRVMPGKFVSIGPMSTCDALLGDLGIMSPDMLLAGIGLISFHISTYDDIVDETPSSIEDIAALIYTGNIALIDGIELLVESGLNAPLHAALEEIKKNSYMQQKITGILWKKSTPKITDYFKGIRHIVSWASIGPMAALAYAKKDSYSSAVRRFCENYGIAIQMIDDINEIDEDLENGYWSLPIIEARKKNIDLRKRSRAKTEVLDGFRSEVIARLVKARAALPSGWVRLDYKAKMVERYVKNYRFD